MRSVTAIVVFWLIVVTRAAWGDPTPTPTPSPSPTPQPWVFGGYFQEQTDDGTLDSSKKTTPSQPVHNGIGAFPAFEDWEIRRFRLRLSGGLSPTTDVYVQTNYDSRSNDVTIIDAYMDFHLTAADVVQVGTYKTKFGIEGMRPDHLGDIIELSDATAALYQNRDVGFNFNHHASRLDWNLGVYDGEQQLVSTLAMRELIGKVDWVVIPNLTVGTSLELGSTSSSITGKPLPVRVYGTEASYRHGRWLFEGEYLTSNGFNFFSKAATRADGYYVRTVYRLSPKVDLMLDTEWFDPNLALVNEKVADNTENARRRSVVGLNYFFRRPGTKLMVDYEFHEQTEGPRVRDNGLRTRYQVYW